MYKHLFESDLKSTKVRTLEELESLKEKSDNCLRDVEILNLERTQLKSFIKRYQRMVKEVKDQGLAPKGCDGAVVGPADAFSQFSS